MTKLQPFSFDSIKNSLWLHVLNGIQKLLPQFKKKLSSRFWEKFTLLHLPYENF